MQSCAIKLKIYTVEKKNRAYQKGLKIKQNTTGEYDSLKFQEKCQENHLCSRTTITITLSLLSYPLRLDLVIGSTEALSKCSTSMSDSILTKIKLWDFNTPCLNPDCFVG